MSTEPPAVNEWDPEPPKGRGMELLRKVGRMAGQQFGEPLLTVGEVAGLMRVSNMTVYRLIKAGDLPAIRVGKNFRIRRSDVESYLGDRSYGG
jgi:excisionase family DNA binding protein